MFKYLKDIPIEYYCKDCDKILLNATNKKKAFNR